MFQKFIEKFIENSIDFFNKKSIQIFEPSLTIKVIGLQIVKNR